MLRYRRLGVTDNEWFHFLSRLRPDEVNFWQPWGVTVTKPISKSLWKLGRRRQLQANNS